MFVCAMDIGRFLLKMVLTVKDPVPLFLERQLFKIPVDAVSILNQLEMWSEFYQEAPKLVSCTQDAWPTHLRSALQNAGYRIKWVEHNDIRRLVKSWRSVCHDRLQWLRAGLMSYLYDHEDSGSLSEGISRLTVLEWKYASMRFQLMEMEGELFIQGRHLCPGHLNPRCPLCETESEHHESKKPCSERGARL